MKLFHDLTLFPATVNYHMTTFMNSFFPILQKYIIELFDNFLDKGLKFIRKETTQCMKAVSVHLSVMDGWFTVSGLLISLLGLQCTLYLLYTMPTLKVEEVQMIHHYKYTLICML